MLNHPDKKIFWLLMASAIVLAAVYRLNSSISNFAPIAAIALFSGAFMKDKKFSFLLPIAAVFLSDCVFEMVKPGYGFYGGQVFNYIAFASITGIGLFLRGHAKPLNILGASLAGTAAFFLISNFGVWQSGLMVTTYPKTFAGLLFCYENALPFARPSLISDLVFNSVFFGSYLLATKSQSLEMKKVN